MSQRTRLSFNFIFGSYDIYIHGVYHEIYISWNIYHIYVLGWIILNEGDQQEFVKYRIWNASLSFSRSWELIKLKITCKNSISRVQISICFYHLEKSDRKNNFYVQRGNLVSSALYKVSESCTSPTRWLYLKKTLAVLSARWILWTKAKCEDKILMLWSFPIT